MDMGFDHDAWPLDQAMPGESGACDERLDWHGLRARFLAARALRHVLEQAGGHASEVTDASFDRSAARAVARFDEGSQGVNLNNSADGKGRFGMRDDVAGAPQPGAKGPVIEGSYD